MKKIREEIKGGEIYKGMFEGLSIFPSPGERSAKTLHTTYECDLSMAYQITVEEEIEPELDKDGKPKEFRSDKKKFHVDVKFPFDIGGMKGDVNLFVYATTQDEIPRKILEAVGNALAELKIRPPMRG